MQHRVYEKWGSVSYWAGGAACDHKDSRCTHAEITVGGPGHGLGARGGSFKRGEDDAALVRTMAALDRAFELGEEAMRAKIRETLGIKQ